MISPSRCPERIDTHHAQWGEMRPISTKQRWKMDMLRSLQSLLGYCVEVRDGHIGAITDFIFEEHSWLVRYIILKTGVWKTHHNFAIPVACVTGHPNWSERKVPISLSMEELDALAGYRVSEKEPWAIELDLRASSQGGAQSESQTDVAEDRYRHVSPPQLLRSYRMLLGLQVMAQSETVGTMSDLIIGDEQWAIQSAVVRLRRRYLFSTEVIIPIEKIRTIRWDDRIVGCIGDCLAIESYPEFRSADPINQEQELRLYDYYGRPRHWEQERDQEILF